MGAITKSGTGVLRETSATADDRSVVPVDLTTHAVAVPVIGGTSPLSGPAQSVENTGDVQLVKHTDGFAVGPTGGGADVLLTDKRGRLLSPEKYDFVHAEDDERAGEDGFWVLQDLGSKHLVRHFDSNGREDQRAKVVKNEIALNAQESVFEADLDGDVWIGAILSPIEQDPEAANTAYGNWQIHITHLGSYALTHASYDPLLQTGPDNNGGEKPITLLDKKGRELALKNGSFTQAEADPDGGFWALLEGGRQSYVYHFDEVGRLDRAPLKLRSALDLVEWEERFQANLNGDDQLGPVLVALEDSDESEAGFQAFGAQQLHRGSLGDYYVTSAGFDQHDPQGEIPLALRLKSGKFLTSSRYDLLQVEQDPSGGFWALENAKKGYALYHFDDSGRLDAHRINLPSSAQQSHYESQFLSDINQDGWLGLRLTPIEQNPSSNGQAYGEIQLHQTSGNSFAVTSKAYDVSLPADDPAHLNDEKPVTLVNGRGVPLDATKLALIHAEHDPAGGYWALQQDRKKFVVHHFDAAGRTDQKSIVLKRKNKLSEWEAEFAADLNADGYLGPDPPALDGPSSLSLPEHHVPSSDPVASFVSSSETTIVGLGFTGGNADGVFAIDAAGQITQVGPLDYETTQSYALTIEGHDQLGNAVTAALTVAVEDENDSPQLVGGGSPTAEFAEHSNAVVFTASATDQDIPGDTLSFALGSGGGDEALFELDPTSGDLTFKAIPDFEAPPPGGDNEYHVELEVRDGRGGLDSQSLTVSVFDILESASPVFTSAGSASFPENTETAAHTVQVTDSDSASVSFSIAGGADAAVFEVTSIGDTSAAVRFQTSRDFESPADANGDNIYEVIIKADDGGAGVALQTLTLGVTNVNEAPTILSGTSARVQEGRSGSFYTLEATDPDAMDTLTFAIDPTSPDAQSFSLTASGALSFSQPPDHANPTDIGGDNIYNVDLTVADALGETATERLTVEVYPEPPKIFSPYVDVGIYGDLSIPDMVASANLQHLSLAFLVSTAYGQAGWAGIGSFLNDTRVAEMIEELKATGVELTVSFGGQAGLEPARVTTDYDDLRALYKSVIDTYGITQLDFDIEGPGIYDTTANILRSEVLADLQSEYLDLSVSYTLPVLTNGLTGSGLAVLETAQNAGLELDSVNIMTMNYGAFYSSGDAGDDAILASDATLAQLDGLGLETEVLIIPMIGVNDVAPERFLLSDAHDLVQYAKDTVDVAGLSMWSLHRDNGNGNGGLSPLHSGISQDDFAFSEIFQAVMDDNPSQRAPLWSEDPFFAA